MLLKVKIVNRLSQIRKEPYFGSTIMSVLEPVENVTYDATIIYKGWYYLEDLNGWAEAADIAVVETIEPYDPLVDNFNPIINVSTENNSQVKYSTQEIKEIIKGINESSDTIDSSKIKFKDGEEEYPLLTFLKALNNSFNNTEAAVTKMNNMPDIPKTNSSTVDNAVLVYKKSYDDLGAEVNTLKWMQMDTNMLSGTSESDPRYANEF